MILAVAHNEFRQIKVDQYLKMYRDMPNEEKVFVDVKGILNYDALKQMGVRIWRL